MVADNIVADISLVGQSSPTTSPMALILVNFPIPILFFLMSIQVMEIIQENFHYS